MKNYIYYPAKFGFYFSNKNIFYAVCLFFKNIFCLIYWSLFGEKEFKFLLYFNDKAFEFFPDQKIDLHVLGEVFLDNAYNYDYGINPKSMLDIGSNIGVSCIYFKLKYPHLFIHAIEPNRDLNYKFIKNTSNFTGIYLHNMAIGATEGFANLIFGKNHLSTKTSKIEFNMWTKEVQTISLAGLLKINNLKKVDIIKCDAEGAEEFILSHLSLSDICNYFVGEIHPKLIDFKKINSKYVNMDNISKANQIIIYCKL